MIVIRLVVFLALAAIALSVGLYLFRKDRRYLVFAWQVFKFSIVVLFVFLTFYALERLVLVL
ncbi:MAG: hypothetical protein H7X91_03200 [Burkholderiales bacterium]|nr:hypothetical protein [Burkholderiales bacterium]